MEQLRAIWCCASPSADSRRTSRILRMDSASSGNSDPPCLKTGSDRLVGLSSASQFCSDRTAIAIPNLDDFLIVIRSELAITITSERQFSSARNDNFHGSESATVAPCA